jgi:hypothetical protein
MRGQVRVWLSVGICSVVHRVVLRRRSTIEQTALSVTITLLPFTIPFSLLSLSSGENLIRRSLTFTTTPFRTMATFTKAFG